MQVVVWVILLASVFPQRKTQHRREQEGEENKTENEVFKAQSLQIVYNYKKRWKCGFSWKSQPGLQHWGLNSVLGE